MTRAGIPKPGTTRPGATGSGLRSLEQSLQSSRSGTGKTRGGGLAVGLSSEIALVRGQQYHRPSSQLRALEERVLGATPARTAPEPLAPPVIEQHRLAQEQVNPLWLTPSPVAPAQGFMFSTFAAQEWVDGSYSPELSAPDTGRFQVEAFTHADQWSPEAQISAAYSAAPAGVSLAPAPAIARPSSPPQFGHPQPSLPPVHGQESSSPSIVLPDEENWLAEAERPTTITAASQQSLNPGLALAKDDFEKELAAILGQNQAPADANQPVAPGSTPTSTPAGVGGSAAAVPTPATAHPNHNIFDQMGLGMSYANSFDLGNVSIAKRLDQLERELAVASPTPVPAQPITPPETTHSPGIRELESPFVDPMSLDEFDLVAELAEIGAEAPAKPATDQQGSNSGTNNSDISNSDISNSGTGTSVGDLTDSSTLPNPINRMELAGDKHE